MTRGRCGSLRLHRMTLSFTTPRRFSPAHKEPTMALFFQTPQLDVNARTSNIPSLILRLSATVIFSCVPLACGGDAPTAPSRGALVTFRVADETFRIHLLDERQIDAAHRAANGGLARIPNGRVVAGT